MFLNLGSSRGGRKLSFLRLDFFGQKNFEPAKEVVTEIINERRFFHIGYFSGNPSRDRKVFISLQDLERLYKLVSGQTERLERMKRSLTGEQELT